MYDCGMEKERRVRPSWKVFFYSTPTGRAPVRDFLGRLPAGHQAKIAAWLQMLQCEGPRLPRPYADHVRGKTRELRVGYSGVEVRILYAFLGTGEALLLHAFTKKRDAIRQVDIDTADQRLVEFERRVTRGEIKL